LKITRKLKHNLLAQSEMLDSQSLHKKFSNTFHAGRNYGTYYLIRYGLQADLS